MIARATSTSMMMYSVAMTPSSFWSRDRKLSHAACALTNNASKYPPPSRAEEPRTARRATQGGGRSTPVTLRRDTRHRVTGRGQLAVDLDAQVRGSGDDGEGHEHEHDDVLRGDHAVLVLEPRPEAQPCGLKLRVEVQKHAFTPLRRSTEAGRRLERWDYNRGKRRRGRTEQVFRIPLRRATYFDVPGVEPPRSTEAESALRLGRFFVDSVNAP